MNKFISRKNFLRKSTASLGLTLGAAYLQPFKANTKKISNDPFDWPSKPQKCLLGKKEIRDPVTGNKIWQMTDGHCDSFVPYQYNQAFSENEKYLIFNSDKTGLNQLYRMEVESGEAMQLTFFEDYVPRPVMHPNGKEVFVIAAGAKIWAINIESGKTRQVVDANKLTSEDRLRGLTISGDGKMLLVTYFRKESDEMAAATASTNGTEFLKEVFRFEYHPIRGEVNRVSHPQFSPTDNNLFSCVKLPDHQGGYPVKRKSIELPDELRARAWLVDITNNSSKPIVVTPPGFRATHEYWAPDGKSMIYHQKTAPGFIPASIKSVDIKSGEVKTIIESESIKFGHSSVNHNHTKIVSDVQEAYHNQLLLIDIESGNFSTLCWPNTSGDSQKNHTHPSFSRSGNSVIYTSDISGFSQVYLVELDDIT